MKKISIILAAAAAMVSLAGCSEWTTPEILDGFDPAKGGSYTNRQEMTGDQTQYWANIREFKKSDHAISFGWYASWTPPENDAFGQTANSLIGLPDSMDMVTLWGWTQPLTEVSEIRQKDLQMAREERGLKVLFCHMCNNLGMYITPPKPEGDTRSDIDYWADYWQTGTLGWPEAAYQYGLAFGEWIVESGFDGIDLDYEPSYGHTGNLASHTDRMQKFIEGLSHYLGPKARGEGETALSHGRVLMVDGEPQTLNSECGPMIDYYNIQAYSISGSVGTPSAQSDASLDSRFSRLISKFGPTTAAGESVETIHRKVIWTENFENVDLHNGGWTYTSRAVGQTRSLRGFALWHYTGYNDVRIGGAGAFKFEGCSMRDATSYGGPAGRWGFIRQMIESLNPAQLPDATDGE